MLGSVAMVLLISVLLLVTLLAVLLAYRLYRQGRNQRDWAIPATGVHETGFVRVGGIDQFISIRGQNRANPVVLVLHGGMATSYVAFTPIFHAWEQHFTVVQWDRRGVGKTYGRHGHAGAGDMTLDRIVEDGIELVEHLRQRLGQDRIVLLGHSMGSMIGVAMAARRGDLFHAYVGTEQIVDMSSNELASYRQMVERLRALGNRRALARLERLGSPPYAALSEWGSKQRIAEVADPAYGRLTRRMLPMLWCSPEYSLADLKDFVAGQRFSGSALYADWMRFDARRLGRAYATPIIIIQGADDVMTPTALVTDWLAGIEAPHKALVRIDGGGHLVMATAPEQYLRELVTRVRPLAAPASGSQHEHGPPAPRGGDAATS